MANIIWEGNQDWGKEFPEGQGNVPADAKKLKRPDDILKASLPYGIVPMILCFACFWLKQSASDAFLFDLRFMPLGLLIGFLLIPVHEFLHAVCYPKQAKVYVGICLKKVAAYAVSFYPIRKSRYIVMSLSPMLLGILPLIVFCICPLQWKALLTICVAPAFMGMISPSPDYMDVIAIIRQVPNGAYIQASNEGLYWFRSPTESSR